MKKLFTTIALTGAVVLGANAQRSVDLTLTYTAPADEFTIPCTADSFEIGYLAINNGPEALIAGDTVWLIGPWHDDGYGQRWVLEEGEEYAAGDTFLTGGLMLHYTQVMRLADPSTGEWVFGSFTSGESYIMGSILQNNAGDASTWTDPNDTNNIAAINVVWCEPSSIFEPSKNLAKIQVYPNPATNDLNFEYSFEKPSAAVVKVVDMTGRTVLTKDFGTQASGLQHFSIPVSQLPNGNYTLELKTGDKRGVSKFTVTK